MSDLTHRFLRYRLWFPLTKGLNIFYCTTDLFLRAFAANCPHNLPTTPPTTPPAPIPTGPPQAATATPTVSINVLFFSAFSLTLNILHQAS